MPILTVENPKGNKLIKFMGSVSIRSILDKSPYRVKAVCSGIGVCGKCLIKVTQSNPEGINELTNSEKYHIVDTQIELGFRLACQTIISKDTSIQIINIGTNVGIINIHYTSPELPLDNLRYDSFSTFENFSPKYGVAIDLGTTMIKTAVFNLDNNQLISAVREINPQRQYGVDILSRLNEASKSPHNAYILNQQITDAISKIIIDITFRNGIDPQKIVIITIVANTAMLALLTSQNIDQLLLPINWTKFISTVPSNVASWCENWLVNTNCNIEIIPAVGGFIGSDLLADLLSCNFINGDRTKLFINFGTNSEIALFFDNRLFITSAAGGPAFEGSGLKCGIFAEAGAIYKAMISEKEINEDLFDVEILDSDLPIGICATGFIDIIAGLLIKGIISDHGKFKKTQNPNIFTLIHDFPELVITTHDLDIFQQAESGNSNRNFSIM